MSEPSQLASRTPTSAPKPGQKRLRSPASELIFQSLLKVNGDANDLVEEGLYTDEEARDLKQRAQSDYHARSEARLKEKQAALAEAAEEDESDWKRCRIACPRAYMHNEPAVTFVRVVGAENRCFALSANSTRRCLPRLLKRSCRAWDPSTALCRLGSRPNA